MAGLSSTRQASLPGVCPVTDAIALLAAAGIERRGAIYTRREVVEFVLDLGGYTSDRPLYSCRPLVLAPHWRPFTPLTAWSKRSG